MVKNTNFWLYHASVFAAYKNGKFHLQVNAPVVVMRDMNLGDAKAAIYINRNPIPGYNLIKDTNIYATTPNMGVPSKVTSKASPSIYKNMTIAFG